MLFILWLLYFIAWNIGWDLMKLVYERYIERG